VHDERGNLGRMARGLKYGWLLALPLLACGDDSARADGSAGGTDSDSAGHTEGESLEGGQQLCSVDSDCNSDDPCVALRCDGGVCAPSSEPPPLINACRPSIEVEHPPRAATLRTDTPTVTVTGTAVAPAGSITALKINGDSVNVAADGSFSHDVGAIMGGNTLVLEVTDSFGRTRKRVQSFLWSPEYRKPTSPPQGIADQGLAFWVAQETIDDGDRSLPYDDLASLLWLVLDQFDPSTIVDPSEPVFNYAYYDIYVLDIRKGDAEIGLAAIDNGISLSASIYDIIGDLYYDCTSWQCVAAGGDSEGDFTIDVMHLEGDVILSVNAEHKIVATLVNVKATIDPDDVNVSSKNSWTNFLLSVVEFFVKDTIVAELEAALEEQVTNAVGPALAEALGGLALATNFEFPSIAGDDPIVVQLFADFRDTDFHDGVAPPNPSPPQGGLLSLRGGGYAEKVVVPYDNLGVPMRDGCGAGGQTLVVPRTAPLEIALGDDLLNQMLYAGWQGGLLELPIEDSTVDVKASGMLAPTASDCGYGGQLMAHIGDVHIDAVVTIGNKSIPFVAYTSLVVGVDIAPGEDGVSLGISGVERIDTELTASEDENIPDEAALVQLLESQLAGLLIDGLGSGLGSFELPPIDLSGQLGMPPGTAMVEIHITDVTRFNGGTLLAGHL
jgi:hypothetical protein